MGAQVETGVSSANRGWMASNWRLVSWATGCALTIILLLGCRAERESAIEVVGSKTNFLTTKDVLELWASIPGLEVRTQQFYDQLRQRCRPDELRGWASEVIRKTAGKPQDEGPIEGVSVKSELPEALRVWDNPVGAAVVRPQGNDPYVIVVYRAFDSFYGLRMGRRDWGSLTNREYVIVWEPDIIVWHSR